MPAYKYYKEESLRHPDLDNVPPSQQTSVEILEKLFVHFDVKPIKVEFSKKNGWSFFDFSNRTRGPRIKLASHAPVLTVIHEFAHYLDWCERKKEEFEAQEKLKRDFFAKNKYPDYFQLRHAAKKIWARRWHGARHMQIVNDCAKLMKTWGYAKVLANSVAETVDWKEIFTPTDTSEVVVVVEKTENRTVLNNEDAKVDFDSEAAIEWHIHNNVVRD